jgi:hypothetical protein
MVSEEPWNLLRSRILGTKKTGEISACRPFMNGGEDEEFLISTASIKKQIRKSVREGG